MTWQQPVWQESGTFYSNGALNPRSSDVSHALRFERVICLRSLDLTSDVPFARDFNRHFTRDAWNLKTIIAARYGIR